MELLCSWLLLVLCPGAAVDIFWHLAGTRLLLYLQDKAHAQVTWHASTMLASAHASQLLGI